MSVPDDTGGTVQPNADFVRVYFSFDDEEGPAECMDVSPEVAADLQQQHLCYTPEDGPGTLWTFIGKGQDAWDYLTQIDSSGAQS